MTMSVAQHRRSAEPSLPQIVVPAKDVRVRVGLLLPVWECGGTERYHLALAKWTRGLKWIGAAFIAGAGILPDMLAELSSLMPVHGCGLAINDVLHTRNHVSESEAIQAVTAQADVMVVWGIDNLQQRLGRFKGPVVVISHGECPWTAATLRTAAPAATHLAAVTNAARAVYPVDLQSRVKVIGMGVELDRIMPSRSVAQIRRDLKIEGTEKVIGYVGRFSPEKNPLRAAEIAGQLGAEYIAVYHGLSVREDAQFRRQAVRCSQGRVRFAGRDWHTGDIFSILDCLVIASTHEGGPLVAIEAWMAGVPIVSTPVGLMTEHPGWQFQMDAAAPLESWMNAVRRLCELTPAAEIRDQAILQYSAAALARRWQDWLYEIVGRKAT